MLKKVGVIPASASAAGLGREGGIAIIKTFPEVSLPPRRKDP